MNCTLYLPYIDFDDNSFYADNSFYSEQSYVETLTNYENAQFELTKKEEKKRYTSCEVTLFNEKIQEETVDSLVSYLALNDVVVLVIKFNFDMMEEEFETDLKAWIRAHNAISSNNKLTDDEKYNNEPTRVLRVKFKNLKNFDTFLDLQNCKLLEPVGDDGYAIITEKVTLGEIIQ